MNDENLIPYSKRSKSEARENGRKGGIASGIARRKKKTASEIAQRIIFSDLDPKAKKQLEKMTGELGEDENTLYAGVVAMQVREALNGSTKAANYIQNLLDTMVGNIPDEREDDELTKSLRELGESL